MNTRKAFCTLALAAAAVLPGAACAQLITSSYFGGSLGTSDARDFCEDQPTGCDKTGTAWRIYSGLGFTRNLGLEIGIVDLGRFEDRSGTTNARMETMLSEALLVLAFPVQRVSLFGKIGGYYAGTKVREEGLTGTREARESNAGLTYGAGLKVDISSRFAVRGDWQHYAKVGGSDTGGELDVNVFMLGLEWRFR